ncbi:hypothetical protein Tco_1428315 [Tanacetum coccineum]
MASPAWDDGKSFNLMASVLVLPYRNIPHISTNSAIEVVSQGTTATKGGIGSRSATARFFPLWLCRLAAIGKGRRQEDRREAVPGWQRTTPGGSNCSGKEIECGT